MIFSQVITSFTLIVCGLLVEKYPNLIAGYNTMSSAEKERVNISALSSFLKQLLISLGGITLIIYGLLLLADINNEIILFINLTVIMVGVIAGLIYVNTNKRFKN